MAAFSFQGKPLSDLTKTEVLATGTSAEHVVGSDTTLYWTFENALYWLPKAGGVPQTVALEGTGLKANCATSGGAIVFQQPATTEQLGRLLLVDEAGNMKKLADLSAADDCVVSGDKVYVEQANVGLYEITLP